MGNNCCREQGDDWLGGTVPKDDEMTTNLPPTTRRKDSWSDPQRKITEYYDILRQMQTDNLTKMREQLKKKTRALPSQQPYPVNSIFRQFRQVKLLHFFKYAVKSGTP